jgi:hypothetical protein
VRVDGTLSELAAYVEAAERDDFCAMAAGRLGGATKPLHSRYEHSSGGLGS